MKMQQRSTNRMLSVLVCMLLTAGSNVYADNALAQKYFASGQAKLRVGDVRNAELLFAQAMQEAPSDVPIAMALAELYVSQQRLDDAAVLIDKNMQTHASDYRVWKAQGLLEQARGNKAQAIAAYEQAFTLGGKEDGYLLSTLQQHYEETGNAGRKKQMENNLQWLKIKGAR